MWEFATSLLHALCESSKVKLDAGEAAEGLTRGMPVAGTAACTNEPTGGLPGNLQALATAVLGLSPEDRAKPTAILHGR
jgi:hypothetical protein